MKKLFIVFCCGMFSGQFLLAQSPSPSPTPLAAATTPPKIPTVSLPTDPVIVNDAEWQFAIPFPGEKRGMAYLWIPPKCTYVRGLIVANQTILEDKVLQDPIIRKVAADQNLGIALFVQGPFGYFMYKNPGEDVGAKFQETLDALAKESGYAEISQAPFLSFGHSGNGIFAWHIAYWAPKRTIGIVGLHCVSSDPVPGDPKATVDGIPVLGISGEYESWGNPNIPLDSHWRWLRAELLRFRSKNAAALMSEVVDPGSTHFSCNEPLTRHIALFIQKACEARLPDSPPVAGTAPVLKEIPMHSGWLTGCNLLSKNDFPASPYDDYKGDWSLAFWQFDQDFAKASESFRESDRGKRDQRLTFVQDGQPVPAEWLETLKFEPINDGMTFKVEGTFLDKTPAGVANSGKPLSHSASGKLSYSLIGGWRGGGEQLSDDTFRVHYGHLGVTDNLMLLVKHPGDSEYAYAEQPCQVKYPTDNKEGLAQTINFPVIGDQKAGAMEIPLAATSSSGLPVEYYVVRGPAVVKGTKLVLSEPPPRTALPMKVTVVAYQWGRVLEPKVQTAQSIEQTFLLTK